LKNEDVFNVSKGIDIVLDHVSMFDGEKITVCTFWRICVFNKIRMCNRLYRYSWINLVEFILCL